LDDLQVAIGHLNTILINLFFGDSLFFPIAREKNNLGLLKIIFPQPLSFFWEAPLLSKRFDSSSIPTVYSDWRICTHSVTQF